MADLNDVVTVQKNGVIAINNLNQTTTAAWVDTSVTPPVPYLESISSSVAQIAAGEPNATTSSTVTATTLIAAGAGTLWSFSVVAAGTASGLLHNSATTGAVSASNALVSAPTTGGVFSVGKMRFSNGLVIVPGSGQSINVTYTLD